MYFIRLLLVITAFAVTSRAVAQDEPAEPPLQGTPAANAFVLHDEVRDALVPLFSSIAGADQTRVVAELVAESAVKGRVVDQQKSTYQVASRAPNKFTIYLKESHQQTRIYCDGETTSVALAKDAYLQLEQPLDNQQAALSLPIPMGTYPEAILSLSMAGVDPSLTFLGGMKSVELVDRNKYRGQAAVHLKGMQKDGVSWDFWIADAQEAKPLRLIIDLTSMLKASNQVNVDEDFSYRLRIDFLTWDTKTKVNDSLFTFNPGAEARRYGSLAEYQAEIAGVVEEHPLLGASAPQFSVRLLDGKTITSNDLKGRVVVLDFWATWCPACVAAMPALEEVVGSLTDEVVFVAVNVGEESTEVKEFVESKGWKMGVGLDQDSAIAKAYRADALPQTVLIGKSGAIESVHVGMRESETWKLQLKDELDVLIAGGMIATAEQADQAGDDDSAGR